MVSSLAEDVNGAELVPVVPEIARKFLMIQKPTPYRILFSMSEITISSVLNFALRYPGSSDSSPPAIAAITIGTRESMNPFPVVKTALVAK